ncbi:MAG TPA: hypothetical protein VMF69_26965, partial [Gemmataceae bacterium]|nr:hypothetical protein [Gemmataceae bacterium]
GLHRVTWDLGRGARQARGPGGGRGAMQNLAPAGMYRVVLTVDGKEHTQGLRLENDPVLKTPTIIAEDEEDEEEREKSGGGRIDD